MSHIYYIAINKLTITRLLSKYYTYLSVCLQLTNELHFTARVLDEFCTSTTFSLPAGLFLA